MMDDDQLSIVGIVRRYVSKFRDNRIVLLFLSSETDAASNGGRPNDICQHITRARYKAVMCALRIACNWEIAKPAFLRFYMD